MYYHVYRVLKHFHLCGCCADNPNRYLSSTVYYPWFSIWQSQLQMMMTTMRMFLLVVMVLNSETNKDKGPHSHITEVPAGTRKCFHYVMMEGQVMEVLYRVINTGQNLETIDCLVQGPKDNFKQVNRKDGIIQNTIAGDYMICFKNMIPDIRMMKYVDFEDFEVIIEGEVKSYADDDEDIDINQSRSAYDQ